MNAVEHVVNLHNPDQDSVSKMESKYILTNLATALENILKRSHVILKRHVHSFVQSRLRALINGATGNHGASAVELVARETDPDTETVSSKGTQHLLMIVNHGPVENISKTNHVRIQNHVRRMSGVSGIHGHHVMKSVVEGG